jgi:aryl carrier-like protein
MKCYGLGLGLDTFRLVALDANFRKLEDSVTMAAYRRCAVIVCSMLLICVVFHQASGAGVGLDTFTLVALDADFRKREGRVTMAACCRRELCITCYIVIFLNNSWRRVGCCCQNIIA